MNFRSAKWSLDGWHAHASDARRATWANDAGDQLIATLSATDSRIRLMDEGALRDYFRVGAKTKNCAIVSVNLESAGGSPAVTVILKQRMSPHGFAFVGLLIVPFRRTTLRFQFEAIESGTTGVRESTVFALQNPPPEVDETTGRIAGWRKDPYDQRFDDEALYTVADDARYDAQFPGHPLTRIRQYLAGVKATLQLPLRLRLRLNLLR